MWLYHAILPHSRCWLGWAIPVVSKQPRHWPEPLPDSSLGWATPDKGRLSDAPRSNATKTHDRPNDRHFVTPADEPCPAYAIDDQLETFRPNRAGRRRSRTTILAVNTPLRPDCHRAARSGFAASTAPAPPPIVPFHSLPPLRSARLDSTIPLSRPDSYRPSPAPNPQMDNTTPAAPPVSQHTAPEHDAYTAAEQLSNTLLSYSHHDWDQGQRADPLCDVTRRYIQLGRSPPRSLCDHLPSHTRPEIADITDLAAKRRLLEGDNDTILLVRKPITAASAPYGHNNRRSRPPFDDPVRIYVPLLARPWVMHACHADASCHLGVTRTLKMVERFYWWVGTEVCTKWWVRRCLICQARKTSRQTIRWPTLSTPLPNSLGISVRVYYFGPLPTTARGNSYILFFTDRFSRRGYVRCYRRGVHSRRYCEHLGKPLYPPLEMPINSPIRQRPPGLRTSRDSRLQTPGCTRTHDKRLPPKW